MERKMKSKRIIRSPPESKRRFFDKIKVGGSSFRTGKVSDPIVMNSRMEVR